MGDCIHLNFFPVLAIININQCHCVIFGPTPSAIFGPTLQCYIWPHSPVLYLTPPSSAIFGPTPSVIFGPTLQCYIWPHPQCYIWLHPPVLYLTPPSGAIFGPTPPCSAHRFSPLQSLLQRGYAIFVVHFTPSFHWHAVWPLLNCVPYKEEGKHGALQTTLYFKKKNGFCIPVITNLL